ncbi:MAG: polyketide cyclase [Candidatus Velthaea sp.]
MTIRTPPGAARNAYRFRTEWNLSGMIYEVADVLEDVGNFVRWWPSAYAESTILEPGGEHGLHRVVRVRNMGCLPYTLDWTFTVTDVCYPFGSTIPAAGDLTGTGVWTLSEDAGRVRAIYDWQVTADKPLLRSLSGVLRPLFANNHDWVMVRGERSLQLELQRRRAASPEQRRAVPAPPPPAFPHSLRRRPA